MSGRGEHLFEPKKLTLARWRRGLSKADLANSIEVSPRTISNYEAGSRKPSVEIINDICRVLKVKPRWFEFPPLLDLKEEDVSF